LWNALVNRVDTVGPIPADRWDMRKYYDPRPQIPGKMYTREGAFLTDDIWSFDADYFGISPIEAERLDPQQRLLLKVAVETLESAHITKKQLRNTRTGVYVGSFTFDNFVDMYSTEEKIRNITQQTHTCGVVTMLSARLSYYFGLTGACLSLDTACSSSLVAFHLACQALKAGEIEQALVAGVNVMFRPEFAITMCYGGFLAKDGRCKTFDASADGYGRGEGAGVLMLKPYARALADGNEIYAIVAGTGCNQDGRTNGITVPNQQAQLELMRAVSRRSGVNPALIGYAEAHGTGTLVGDPKEAASLGQFLLSGRDGDRPYYVGSVKTNIGHQEAGAGVAALIKTALSLKHAKIAPNLHFNRPNPEIDFDGLRLRVPTETLDLEADYACVNSFGFGGTNAHAILRKPFVAAPSCSVVSLGLERPTMLPLSARTEGALKARASQFAALLEHSSLEDLLHTTCSHRDHENVRASLVVNSKVDAIEKLRAFADGQSGSDVRQERIHLDSEKELVFLYTGMGPQSWGMGSKLMRAEPVFAQAIQRMDETFRTLCDWSLTRLFSEPEAFGAAAGQAMNEPRYAQPANLALQLALTEVWAARGLRPTCVIGHSVGEIAAACVAGSLSTKDALTLAYHRGQLHQQLAGRGGMLAVGASLEQVSELIRGKRVSVAALNSAQSLTLAGDDSDLRAVARALDEKGVFCKRLQVTVPYHSVLMEETREDFFDLLLDIRPSTPKLRLCSTVSGQWVTGAEQGTDYWWRNSRESVRFLPAVQLLLREGYRDFVEIGPHPVLRGAVQEIMRSESVEAGSCIETLHRNEDELERLERTLAELYVRGIEPDWRVFASRGQRLSLPAYPWDESRFALFQDSNKNERLVRGTHPLLQEPSSTPGVGFRTEINPEYFPWLSDHAMQGQAILPGATYVEIMLACAALASAGGDGWAVRDVKFESIQSVQKNVEFAIDVTGDRVEVHGREVLSEQWQRRASGRVVKSRLVATAPPLDLPAAGDPNTRVFERAQIYPAVAKFGYHFGPKFQVVEQFQVRDNVVYGLIDVSALGAELDAFFVHPIFLDGVFQVLNAVYVAEFPAASNGQYLPSGVDEVRLFRRGLSKCWVRCAIPDTVSRTVSMDITLYDLDGTVVGEVRGYRSKVVSTGTRDARADTRDLLYAIDWEFTPWPNLPAAEEQPESEGEWLVFADRGGLAAGLCEGQRALVVPSDCWGKPERLRAELGRLCGDRRIAGVLYGWALDSTGVEEQADVATGTVDCVMLVEIGQALLRSKPSAFGKLMVLTSADPSATAGRPRNPGQGALAGFCRTLNLEHPELAVTWLDVPEKLPDHARRRWLRSADFAEREVSLRADGYLAPKLTGLADVPTLRVASESVDNYGLSVLTPGKIDSLAFVQQARCAPGPNEVEVEVRAAGLNFKDLMKVLGLLDADYIANTHFGDTLGMECAGVVSRVGAGVTRLRVGDAVVAGAVNSFAKYTCVPEKAVFSKPSSLSFEQAVITFVNATPVYYGLIKLANLKKGERVLIHSASGGVGLVAIQMAKLVGAEVFATAGSEEKRQYLRELGVRHVSDSRSLAFYDDVLAWTGGQGVDVVLNFLTGELMEKSLELLRFGGRFVELGKADILSNQRIGLGLFAKNISYSHVDLDHMSNYRPDLCLSLMGEVLALYEQGQLGPIRTTAFRAASVVEAFERMRTAEHIGKLVLNMADVTELRVVPQPQALVVRNEGTYLITGGFSELGLMGAQWLIDAGARRLCLVGRSGAKSQEDRERIASWREQGILIDEARADIASEPDVRRLAAAQTQPVLGVLHLATVYRDAPFLEQTPESFREVLSVKAWGAFYLLQHLKRDALDWFVSFSSVSALGNAAQTNYSAANAYLDALAHRYRGEKLTMRSVNWGVVRAGEITRNPRLLRHFESIGVTPLSLQQIFPILAEAAAQPHAQLAALDIEWARFLKHGGLANAGLFSRLARAITENAAGGGLAQALAAAGPEEQKRLAETVIVKHVSQVLRIASERVDADTRMDELGVDSLMAVTLSHAVELETGVELGSVRFLQKPTVRLLASDWLTLKLAQMNGRKASDQAASEDWVRLQTPSEPLLRLVCVPGARMSPSEFAAWSDSLPGVELFGLRYAGSVDRPDEEPTSVEELAATAALALERLPETSLPLVLFGHSFGGLVAYETVRALQASGVAVAGLILAASSTPDARYRFDSLEIERATSSLAQGSGAKHEHHLATVRRLLAGYTVQPEQRDPLTLPVTLILAEKDEFFNNDKLRGWQAFADDLDVQTIDVGHFMLSHAEVVAKVRTQCERWQGRA